MPGRHPASMQRPKPDDGDAATQSPREIVAAWFSFHRLCRHRNCRRAQRCEGGETPSCFSDLWPHVPEEQKVRLRATFLARHAGASAEAAMVAGEAAAARFLLEQVR